MAENKFNNRASDFDSVGELLNFLENNNDIKIVLESYEYWSGWIQQKNQDKSENVEHLNIIDLYGETAISVENGNVLIGEDYEGYDLMKKPIETKFYCWGKGDVDKNGIIEMLSDFIDSESSESDFYEFIDHYVHSEEYYDTFETFEVENTEEGKGQEIGIDDISWNVFQELNEFNVDFLIFKS